MKKKYDLFNLFPENYRKLILKTLLTGFCILGFLSTSIAQIQFVYTSDAHYGITRARFQKSANVGAQIVNQAMISKMNNLTNLTFPLDGGVKSGLKVDSVDFVVMTGDIANRSETTIIPTLSASTCWSQFSNDYITGMTLKNKAGIKSPLYLLPGNHDVTNAVGFYKTMSPLKDSSAMVNIYNMMMPSPRPAGNYDYANEKIHYSKNIGGIHLMFVCMWPDSAERVWMTNDLATVSQSTPVFIFTHDQPAVESKHFTNPNSPYTINSTNKFENLLLERFKDGTAITAPTTIEQNGFASFVQSHPNIVIYFHGNDNQNNYYKYYGPSNNIALDVIQVDSPMKGNISASNETKLSFQLITIDTLSKVLTVRECLWNTDTNNVNAPIVFGNSKTINFDVANYAQNPSNGNTKISSASDLHLMHPSLLVNDGVAFQTYLASDRKLIKESNAIMQELKNRIYEERPDIFLVPGDLTKDGEKISHQLMATYLDSIEMNGVTKVFVIPGNHDVNNVTAYSYDGNNVTKVDSVSPSDFKSIYNNFGYSEAVKTDTVSLSYLAKPKSKTWVLGIDVLEYDSNMVAGQAITEGKFKPQTYKWVLDRLKEAKDSSATVLGMMHHGLTEHYTTQSLAFPEYVVLGWDTISKNFAKAGLRMMFTGHYHANDITKKTNTSNASFVYDIETGSTVTWPCPYRVMELKGDSILNVVTNHIQNH
ncbi:MAG: metallophosphoesterase [Bacteroidales bacterium]